MAVDFALAGGKWTEMGYEKVENLVKKLYARRCRIREDDDLVRIIQKIIREDAEDFCWSLCFKPAFLANLFYEGFLPICSEVSDDSRLDPLFVLLPKMHRERCLIHLPNVKVGHGTRKKAKRFDITVDTAFPRVMKGCIQQHGESWLHPPVQKNFLMLFLKGQQKPEAFPASIHSIEVWDRTSGQLAAGELGYVCGSCYTSLSGFFFMPGAGSVQLAALGGLLVMGGFKLWDLGMSMAYKEDFGGTTLPREEFLALLRTVREDKGAKLATPSGTAERTRCPANEPVAALGLARAAAESSIAVSPTLKGNEEDETVAVLGLAKFAEETSPVAAEPITDVKTIAAAESITDVKTIAAATSITDMKLDAELDDKAEPKAKAKSKKGRKQ